MKLAAMFGSSTGAVATAAGAAVLLVAGAIGLSIYNRDGGEPIGPDRAAVPVVSPDIDAAGSADEPERPETPDAAVDAPDIPEGDAGAPAGPAAPVLDHVRVEPDGTTIIAGQAAPGAQVSVLLDGVELLTTSAGPSGSFVALFTLAPSDTPRRISVEASFEDGTLVAGEDTIIVAPFDAPAPIELAALPEAGEATPQPEVAESAEPPEADPAEDSEVAITEAELDGENPVIEEAVVATREGAPDVIEPTLGVAETASESATPSDAGTLSVATGAVDPVQPDAPAAEDVASAPDVADPVTEPPVTLAAPQDAAAPTEPDGPTDLAGEDTPTEGGAPAVLIAGPEGIRITQGPGAAPDVQTEVRLDAISYDAEGAVILAGRGPAASDIQVSLNNQPIQLGEIGPGGAWSLQLPDVDPGTYTLVVAELAEDGTEASRVETPFLREDPERVADAPIEAAEQGIDVITVQPGFTLWGMARDTFGDGILYVQIFEENRDQIRDPNWIFPGQIFRMPEIE